MIVATAFSWMAIDELMGTMGTDPSDEIRDVLDLETIGNRNTRDLLIFEADGTATDGTGQVHMIAEVQTVLLLATAIIDRMEQIMFGKKGQGTEQRTAIYGR